MQTADLDRPPGRQQQSVSSSSRVFSMRRASLCSKRGPSPIGPSGGGDRGASPRRITSWIFDRMALIACVCARPRGQSTGSEASAERSSSRNGWSLPLRGRIRRVSPATKPWSLSPSRNSAQRRNIAPGRLRDGHGARSTSGWLGERPGMPGRVSGSLKRANQPS